MSDLIVKEVHVLPSGVLATEDNWDTLRSFALSVQWRGPRTDKGRGGYGVTQHGSRWLSCADNWGHPEAFQQHQYRWDTLDEAIEHARRVVDEVKVNGWTWVEWQEYEALRGRQPEAPVSHD